MSLLSQFENSLPLTPKTLVEWLKILLQKIEPTSIDSAKFESIYASNRGANITSILSVSEFDSIHEAIQFGQKVEISGTGVYMSVAAASIFDVVSDGFYSFSIGVINSESEYISLSISKIGNVIYLDGKSTTTLGS